MRLVLFKDLLEDEAASQYGIVLDGDEPDVICLCCGSTIEFGDYEIYMSYVWMPHTCAMYRCSILLV